MRLEHFVVGRSYSFAYEDGTYLVFKEVGFEDCDSIREWKIYFAEYFEEKTIDYFKYFKY